MHETEIISFLKLRNGQYVFTVRCCGNPATDTNHTLAANVVADPDERNRSLTTARELSAKSHQDALDANAAAVELVGEKKEHS